ncbi:hypothetical protein H4582DRAFT_2089757 [Lactarius indigo]|nr:hypothetical protein H4582DRAFT_2089757 [Lactarius indigo]
MAGQQLVFCVCCNKHIPRKCEREHRCRVNNLKLLATPTPHKRPQLAFKDTRTPRNKPRPKTNPTSELPGCQDVYTTDPDPDAALFQDTEILEPSTSNGKSNHQYHFEDSRQGHADELLVACMSRRWHRSHDHLYPGPGSDDDSNEFGHDLDRDTDGDDNDDGKTSNAPFEEGPDGDESDIVDWGALDQECGLAGPIYDELGEDFESKCAKIGERLDECDRTICRAFAFKISTYMTDAAWKKACCNIVTTLARLELYRGGNNLADVPKTQRSGRDKYLEDTKAQA